jgi:hypothetical protein
MRAIFLCEKTDKIFEVYAEQTLRELKTLVEIEKKIYTKEDIISNEGAPTDEIKDASDMKAVTLGRKSLRRSSNKNTKTDNKG